MATTLGSTLLSVTYALEIVEIKLIKIRKLGCGSMNLSSLIEETNAKGYLLNLGQVESKEDWYCSLSVKNLSAASGRGFGRGSSPEEAILAAIEASKKVRVIQPYIAAVHVFGKKKITVDDL